MDLTQRQGAAEAAAGSTALGSDRGADTRQRVGELVFAVAEVVYANRLVATRVDAANLPPETPVKSTAWAAMLSELHERFTDFLNQHTFLHLRIVAHGFAWESTALEVNGESVRDLAALLTEGGVAELVFKVGLSAEEMQRLVRVLQRFVRERRMHTTPANRLVDNVATALWEADLTRITFRGADEGLQPENLDVEPFDMANAPIAHADELVADTRSDPAFSAASPREVFPALRVGRLPESFKSVMFLTEEEEQMLRVLRLSPPRQASLDLVHQLVGIHAAERDSTLLDAAFDVLMRVVEIALEERKLVLVRDILVGLRAVVDAGEHGQLERVLRGLSQRLCTPEWVLLLGTAFEDQHVGPTQAAAAREIVSSLDHRAIGPLCTLLSKLESMQARKYVCSVLAIVGAAEPGNLAKRGENEPWYVVRNLAYVMGEIGTDRVLPYLQEWMSHYDPRVRDEVARALGKVRHTGATGMLCTMLNDTEARVRRTATWSLAAGGDRAALPLLKPLLFDDKNFREREPEERDDCFRTYGRLVDDAGFQELAQLVEQRPLLPVGWKVDLRRCAAIALCEADHPRLLEVLQKHASSNDTRVREICVRALESHQDRTRSQAAGSGNDAAGKPGERPESRADSGVLAWEEEGGD